MASREGMSPTTTGISVARAKNSITAAEMPQTNTLADCAKPEQNLQAPAAAPLDRHRERLQSSGLPAGPNLMTVSSEAKAKMALDLLTSINV